MANSANLKKIVKSLQVICNMDSTKVLKASICLYKAQNLIQLSNFSQKNGVFFRQNKIISVSTLHFDDIFFAVV